jgi:hypothetical protein
VRRRGSEESLTLPVERIAADLGAEIGSRSATLTVGRSA